MPDDERAFLTAITAAPADDTVRLVYADWLDEHSQAARAAFIRAQVEAETLHPHSARRAELDARAEQFLAEHWVEWWSPVCASVGLPLPQRKPATRLGRIARSLNIAKPTGDPYEVEGVEVREATYPRREALKGFWSVQFRRGFPESLEMGFVFPQESPLLRRWTAFPLTRLSLTAYDDDWEGPHLAGVNAVEFFRFRHESLAQFLRSRSLPNLEEVRFVSSNTATEWVPAPLRSLAASPLAPRLRRLWARVWNSADAAAVAVGFDGLTSLELDFPSASRFETHETDDLLLTVARSPRLGKLSELKLSGGFSDQGLRDAVAVGGWTGLRRLSIHSDWDRPISALPEAEHLPALEDLSITGATPSPDLLAALVASPLTKRLRHFALGVREPDALRGDDWRRLAAIVDPATIETFWVGIDYRKPGIHLLRQRLGDKLRTPR